MNQYENGRNFRNRAPRARSTSYSGSGRSTSAGGDRQEQRPEAGKAALHLPGVLPQGALPAEAVQEAV